MARFAIMARLSLVVSSAVGIHVGASAAQYPDVVLQDSPVAYFRFEEQSGSQIRDSRANSSTDPAQRNVTARGLTLSAQAALLTRKGVTNRAAQFTGASYVHATADPDVFEFDGAVSIEFWIRPTKGGEATQCLIAKGEFTRTDCSYYVVYFQEPSGESGRLRFGIAGGHIDQTSKLIENEFTHVVVTFNPAQSGDNTEMYINGELDATKRIDGKPRSTEGTPLSIGALYYKPPKMPRIQFFVGELDEVAFYKHALPERRVAAHVAHATAARVFEADVRPIFQLACFDCHGEKPQGDLDLRTLTAMLRGGINGPAVVRGEAGQSLLTERVEFDEMHQPIPG